MSLTLPKALLLGTCGLFLLMGLGQAVLLWSFQQQLQQELSTQSQTLSRIILARTTEKLEISAKHLTILSDASRAKATSCEPPATMDPTEQLQPSEANSNQPATMVITGLNVDINAHPNQLQQQLEQTLAELGQHNDQAGWVRRFKIENADSSAQLTAEYLKYQLLALTGTVLLVLLIALWQGNRLLQPLQRLQQGFRALAAGQAGVQLDTGAPLQEYRELLQQFNQTSQELAALQAQKAELARQQQLVELGEISRGLVHAMRNPIHTMALALDQLPDTAPQLKHLIEQKMQHLNRTLTSLLTLSCAAIDRQQQVNLKTVLQDLALEFYHAGLRIDCSDDVTIAGAESELRFIFHVLISNAVEASPQPGSVQVRLQQQADGSLLQVCDQGPGLAPDISQQLFSPHVSSKADGAGMGLYLAKRLLELYYHAQLSLVNAPAGGCVASVTFRREAI